MNNSTVEKEMIVLPTQDFSFKQIFSEKNAEIAVDFLQSMLTIPEDEYDRLEFSDPHLLRTHEDDKLGIVDLLIHTKSKKIIHVELQIEDKTNFRKRAIYYNAKMVTEQLQKGIDYDKIEKTISILITYFPMFDSPDYTRKINLRCEDGALFDDVIEFHTLEISKVPKEFDGSKKCEWAKFFASKKEGEFNMCAERNPEIRKAVGVLMELSQDEKNRMIATQIEKMRRDRVAEIAFGEERGRQKGIEQGIKQGTEQGKIEIAKSMLENNLTIEMISNCTNLPEETILSLQSEL